MASEDKPRILVVDDDKNLQRLVQTLLQRYGMHAILAGTATEAVEALKQRPMPDIVLLDLMLPDISGVEFLRQMRTRQVFDKTPVVILSAMADPDKIREGLQAGADRYLTKPYLANNLVDTLRDLLKNGRPRK